MEWLALAVAIMFGVLCIGGLMYNDFKSLNQQGYKAPKKEGPIHLGFDMTMIVATDMDNGIGLNGDIPWKCAEDMKNFKELTTGGIVIMGRKTFQSIGRPLPNRHNIIISKQLSENIDASIGFEVVPDIQRAISAAGWARAQGKGLRVFVIGGGEIYKALAPYCNKIYHSTIPGHYDCDTFFDVSLEDYDLVSSEDRNQYIFNIFRRVA